MTVESLQDELEKARAALKVAKGQIIALNKEVEVLKTGSPSASDLYGPADLVALRLNEFISCLGEGVVFVDEYGKIIHVNEEFCRQFGISSAPDALAGADFASVTASSRQLFSDPAQYAAKTNKIVADKKPVLRDELHMVSGQIFFRDHLPVYAGGKYRGYIWKYHDATRNKTIEDTFVSQKNFYEQILNNMPVSIAVFDAAHKYLFVNPLAIGKPELRKWIIGKTDEEYCRHTGKPLSLAVTRRKVFNEVASKKTAVEWEEQITAADGEIKYHQRKMSPVFNEADELEIVIGYGADVTEQKKIEDQIEIGQKRYRDIFNFSQAWICTHDMKGCLLTINPAACELLEFESFELLGKPIDSLMPEKVKKEFSGAYLKKISVEGKADGIMKILNKRGKTLFLLYQNYLVNEPGSEPYVIGFAQNITQRIYAEEALKRSEEKYRGIIDNMNLGMIEIDNDERIIYANQRFCTMSGYEATELVGKKATELLLHGAGLKMTRTQLSKQQYGTSNNYELAVKTKIGEDRWWLTTATPLLGSDGNVKGTIGINLDITEQKKTQELLKEAMQQADKSSISKDLFMTNMSHEIRTPLNAIMGLGKLLSKSTLSAQQKQYLAGVESASENLLGIINDLLDFSKIEAGKITIEYISFSIEHVGKQAIDILFHKAEEKGLLLNIIVDDKIAPVLIGDPYRINQVLLNMLSNAIKFTEKGSVSLLATVLSQTEDSQKVQIQIKDTGVGINEKYLENIFDKFTQEDETVVRKFGGTGLGMSITRQLVELMGGTIAIDSTKNVGTTISLVFDFKIGTSRVFEKKRTIKNDTAHITGKKILLVEDNNLNRLLAYTILTDYGAIVEEAENGLEAVEKVSASAFDIILMDVQMPVMDGLQATRIIRRDISKDIPIIALTANAIKGKENEFFEAGMNDFIYKPYNEVNLVNPIAKWLPKNIVEEEPVIAPVVKTTDALPVVPVVKGAPLVVAEPIVVPAVEVPAPVKSAPPQQPPAQKNEPEKKQQVPVAEKYEGPLYDISKLQSIGSDDFVKRMLKLFVAEVPSAVMNIKIAYDSSDFNTIKYLTHRIRPSIQNMGIAPLAEDVVLIEQLAAKGQKDPDLKSRIDRMTEVIDLVSEQLKKKYRL